jgi:hypothetical protein
MKQGVDAARAGGPARSRSRWLVRLAVVLIAALGFLFWVFRGRTQNFLTVENRSGQAIALLQFTVAGQTQTVRDMAAGGEKSVALPARGDDPLVVEGRLADGTRIRGRFGSVAAVGERARLIVLPGGQIVFRQAGKPS